MKPHTGRPFRVRHLILLRQWGWHLKKRADTLHKKKRKKGKWSNYSISSLFSSSLINWESTDVPQGKRTRISRKQFSLGTTAFPPLIHSHPILRRRSSPFAVHAGRAPVPLYSSVQSGRSAVQLLGLTSPVDVLRNLFSPTCQSTAAKNSS